MFLSVCESDHEFQVEEDRVECQTVEERVCADGESRSNFSNSLVLMGRNS